jgi:hypothetical protein
MGNIKRSDKDERNDSLDVSLIFLRPKDKFKIIKNEEPEI